MSERQRIDQWLWFARLVKTRPLSAGLVENGRVRLNGTRIVKPGHAVKPGDVVTFAYAGRVRVLEVLQNGLRRGPASEAWALYRDLQEADPGSAMSENGLQRPQRLAIERSE